ncbi:MAG: DUF2851 family protein [Bacteroidetes bacterium]|nr:DUF2851 family protein [Bacteroidota bacterium]
MRPVNFPTIRASQLIVFLQNTKQPFFLSQRDLERVKDFHSLFDFPINEYWSEHYLFDKSSVKKDKSIGKNSIDNLIINTIAPFLYAWGTFMGSEPFKLGLLSTYF